VIRFNSILFFARSTSRNRVQFEPSSGYHWLIPQ